MDKLAELEARIIVLEDTEAIKRLKAKYWRCLDRKLWTEMEAVFAKDATADYGPKYHLAGREAILQFLKANLGPDSVSTSHGGHSPDIGITGNTTANGIWTQNNLMVRESGMKIMEWGHYEDEYVKEDGCWRINRTKIVNIVEERTMTKRIVRRK
ncbi:MAG: nuclear transport factor 2 family protein [Chloroflexi bacterium]|nr:nuclear transport factor 2 family protein [Chloroflexota bacterium]